MMVRWVKYYVVLFLLLLAGCSSVNYDDWGVNFSRMSRSPFGTACLESVLSHYRADSLMNFYEKREFSWTSDSSITDSTDLLVIDGCLIQPENMDCQFNSIGYLNKRLDAGLSTMIVSSDFPMKTYSGRVFKLDDLIDDINDDSKLDTATIMFCENPDSIVEFKLPRVMCSRYIDSYVGYVNSGGLWSNLQVKEKPNVDYCEVLATVDGYTVAERYVNYKKKSCVIFVSIPMIFTNYSIMNDNASLIALLIRYLRSPKLDCYITISQDVRKMKTDVVFENSHSYDHSSSIFGIISDRLVYLLVLILLVLPFLLIGKRRESIIPVIEKPSNKVISFVRQIAGLYASQEDYTLLVCRKFTFFSHFVKERMFIRLNDPTKIENNAYLLSCATRVSEEKIYKLLKRLIRISEKKEKISADDAMKLIDRMNKLKDNLK